MPKSPEGHLPEKIKKGELVSLETGAPESQNSEFIEYSKKLPERLPPEIAKQMFEKYIAEKKLEEEAGTEAHEIFNMVSKEIAAKLRPKAKEIMKSVMERLDLNDAANRAELQKEVIRGYRELSGEYEQSIKSDERIKKAFADKEDVLKKCIDLDRDDIISSLV